MLGQPMLTGIAMMTIGVVVVGFAVLLAVAYQHGRHR